jgi:Trm5-related predicted tRNA methylase
VVRYEKGNFSSGYCIVEQRKIAIVNKFFDVEGRINSLSEILSSLNMEGIPLTEASAKFYERWKKRSVEEDEENMDLSENK